MSPKYEHTSLPKYLFSMVYVASLIIYLHNFYRKMNVVEKFSDQKSLKKIKKIRLLWQSFNHYLFINNLMIF